MFKNNAKHNVVELPLPDLNPEDVVVFGPKFTPLPAVEGAPAPFAITDSPASVIQRSCNIFFDLAKSNKPEDVMSRIKLAESVVVNANLMLEEAKATRRKMLGALGVED